MNEDFDPQAIKTIAALREIEAERGALPSFQTSDNNFRHYVRDENDVHGMVAYGLYKFQKIKLCEENPALQDEALAAACRQYVMGRRFEANKKEALKRLALLENLTIARFAKEKNRREWFVGVCSGLVASLIAPILFWAIVSLVHLSGVTQPLMLVAQSH